MGGWLVNKKRRERRDRADTMTAEYVEELIGKIQSMETYSMHGDTYLRLRDIAFIVIAWMFARRPSEVLELKVSDIKQSGPSLAFFFKAKKKLKRRKICPGCSESNARKSIACWKCAADLKDVQLSIIGDPSLQYFTLYKSKDYPFCIHILNWLAILKELKACDSSYLFAPFSAAGNCFIFSKHVSVRWFSKTLSKLDPTLTSCLFRPGGIEYMLKHKTKDGAPKYTRADVREIVHLSTDQMVNVYADRKGLTDAQRRFAEDTT